MCSVQMFVFSLDLVLRTPCPDSFRFFSLRPGTDLTKRRGACFEVTEHSAASAVPCRLDCSGSRYAALCVMRLLKARVASVSIAQRSTSPHIFVDLSEYSECMVDRIYTSGSFGHDMANFSCVA